jgi:Ras-related GTP-binding protein C/D
MPPSETLFLPSTPRIQKDTLPSFVDFQVWDFPGQVNFLDNAFDVEDVFGDNAAVIWVIDAQDDYLHSLNQLHETIIHLQQSAPHVIVEVFIHKVDALSDDYKMDTYRDILQRTQDELSDAGYENDATPTFYLTSIYDHSIFDAFSKVIQKLIPQLPTLEGLLNVLIQNSGMDKAYLFDVYSKLYVATDSTPVDLQSYEICSDYIDVIVDVSDIYGRSERLNRSKAVKNEEEDEEEEGYQEAESVIKLSNGTILYLREINKYVLLNNLRRTSSTSRY